MMSWEQVPWSDFKPARLLAGLTRDEMAAHAGRSVSAVERLEWGLTVQARTRKSVFEALWELGIRFRGPSELVHVDGRCALTKKIAGSLNGDRLRKARSRLGLAIEDVATRSGLSCRAVQRIEAKRSLGAPCLQLYAHVGALQLAGYCFRIGSQGGRSGDVLIPPSLP